MSQVESLSRPDLTPQSPTRTIVHRTRGHSAGFITRLMSPSDRSADLVKPFVFLDRFEGEIAEPPPIDAGWHPHSGIATVTVVLDGATRYAETTGAHGTLRGGSVEWMRAGGGVWHTGSAEPGPVRGFQLWVALPPELENAPSESRYLGSEEVPTWGPARVVLGSYRGVSSPISALPLTYLSVGLKDGERFRFEPPEGHAVAWIAVMNGRLQTPDSANAGELVLFDSSETPIEMVAQGETRFVLGSAKEHTHELFLGNYSVHTSREALQRGEAEILRLGKDLRASGKRSYALRSLP